MYRVVCVDPAARPLDDDVLCGDDAVEGVVWHQLVYLRHEVDLHIDRHGQEWCIQKLEL